MLETCSPLWASLFVNDCLCTYLYDRKSQAKVKGFRAKVIKIDKWTKIRFVYLIAIG